MRDVAALAGVSLKTVSRVVNGEAGVSPALVASVEHAVAQLDYRHNLAASNLRRGQRTSSVGALLHDIGNNFSATLLRALEDRVRPRRMAVLSASLDEEVERERALAQDLVSRRVDGLVLMPAGADQSYLQADISAGLAVVAVDRPPFGVEVDTVLVDNAGGAGQAVRHLAAVGHRRIACLTDRRVIWTARERERGFCEAMAAIGFGPDPGWVISDIGSESQSRLAVTRLLGTADPPTAIFAGQNAITVGAIRALRALGRQADVAVVGFDDFPLADMLEPAVTVVGQDVARIGDRVAELLLERIDGRTGAPVREIVPTRLVPRGSGEIRVPRPRAASG